MTHDTGEGLPFCRKARAPAREAPLRHPAPGQWPQLSGRAGLGAGVRPEQQGCNLRGVGAHRCHPRSLPEAETTAVAALDHLVIKTPNPDRANAPRFS